MAALPLVKLHHLDPQVPSAFFALLSEKIPRTTRNEGKPYYSCRFRDRKRIVHATIWPDSPWAEACEKHWSVGGLYRIQGVLFDNDRYGLALEIRDIRDVNDKDRTSGLDERDFFDQSRFDPKEMFDELVAIVQKECENEAVRMVIINLLTAHAGAIIQLPASNGRYHPFPGGWLEHTLSVCKTSLWLVDHYRNAYSNLTPPLNRDLVLAGAVLHEIGRVAEFTLGLPGQPPDVTIPGRLFGHSILARDLIRSAAATVPDLNPEFVTLLGHIVLTHLTLPEWGSPRLPAIPEVLILHHADDLDAKVEMYARCLMNDISPGPFTEPDPVLKKLILKQRSV